MAKPAFRLKGTVSFGLALLAGRLVQAAAFFVMARFLDASQMGVVAILAVLFVAFFQMTNLGFDSYIVYAKSHNAESLDKVINAVWTLQLIRGLLILLAAVPIAIVLNRFTDIDVGYLYVFGLVGVVILLSLVHPGLAAFERGGDFSRISRARAISASAGGFMTILLVVFLPFPWVYIVGQAASAFILVGMSFLYSSKKPQILLETKPLGEVFSFGKHIILISTVSFLSAQAQHAYIGGLFGSAALGAYYTWERLVSLPRELIAQILDKVFFAMASDRARRNVAVGSAYLVGFALTMAVMVPFNLFVWFHGDSLMTMLAGGKWSSFFWTAKFFVLISFGYSMASTIGPFMLVLYPHITSSLRSVETVVVIILMSVFGPKFGIVGVLSSILAVISIAVILRIIVLYTLIIHIDRLRHAGIILAILAGISVPILLWEGVSRFLISVDFQFVGAIVFYALFFISIAALAFPKRRQILQGLK